ncbi:Phosphoribosylformimino-5-aminoimidazole carboxamide ribotide isomerase [Planctomycetales bacterium 10988]|nr:Phosphoribosylformimino-5-aminoimidazole carboxamide ribotide isomerase [Planctomycetales bacterium 10988]
MEIWPAIDLRAGRCVRLRQGDYDQETVFAEDPAEMAIHWVQEGARRLHLVDLDGAKEGSPQNLESVRRILQEVDVPCQLGGGVREESTIETLLSIGLKRVIVGTQALKNPDWFANMCSRFPQQLVLGIDARDGMVATGGWLETSQTPALELASQFEKEPVAGIIFTDISTDGMLQGPNLKEMQKMQQAVSLPVIASGGVARVKDVLELAAIPMDGVIIGRALYEKRFSLQEALAAAESVD